MKQRGLASVSIGLSRRSSVLHRWGSMVDCMNAIPSVEEALERAKRVQEDRLNAVTELVTARQQNADAQERAERRRRELETELAEQLKAAEDAELTAFNRALHRGWTEPELKKIGLPAPAKKARTRRRTQKRAASPATTAATAETSEAMQ